MKKYILNRFLSYYFLDFSLLERIGLWKRFLAHELFRTPTIKISDSKQFHVGSIHVISLPYRTDRRHYIQTQLKSCNISFEYFNAVDGHCLGANIQFFNRQSIKNLTEGSKGCAASHINLWKAIARSKSKKECLHIILEDDVIIKDDFVKSIRHEEFPADLDMLFFGGWNTRGRDINHFVSPKVFSCYNPRKGLYAYALTVEGASKLVKHSIPLDIIYGGIDTKVGKLVRQGKIRAYHLYPPIVDVNFSLLSDIYNPSQPDKRLFERN